MSDDFSIFYGFGSLHDLQAHHEPHRLAGLRSVKNLRACAISPPPAVQSVVVGFHSPKGK